MGQERILLVDDEPNILSSLCRELHGWAVKNGVSLVTAPSGAAALQVLEEEGAPIGVIVSDVRMPEMRGTDLLLKVHEKHPHISTMLLSGYSDIDEVMKGIKAGVFSYIMKPWNPELLQAEIGKALSMFRLRERERVLNAHVRDDLVWAGELQRILLKSEVPSLDRIEYSVAYRPMAEFQCSGDFYEVFVATPGRCFFVIGDVAGHGVRAALVTAVLHSLIHSDYLPKRPPEDVAPGDFLRWLNNRVVRDFHRVSDMMVTCAACDIDTVTLRLRYASAGHPPLLLLHGGNAVPIKQDGPALGMSPEASYPETSRMLDPGDLLMLYTDGILEISRGAASDGRLRLSQVACREASAASFNDAVIRGVLEASGADGLSDDLAMISIRVRKE